MAFLPFVQNLRGHVALRSNLRVVANVNRSVFLSVRDCQSKVSDDALSIYLHEDVLRLQVTMSDRRLALLAEDFRVQVNQAAGDGKANCDHLVVTQVGAVQMVVERAELIVMSDEPQLRAWVPRRHVRPDVAQNVLVTQQDGAVDLCFALPRFLVAAEENFDGNVLAVPDGAPHFAVAAAANAFRKRHLTGQRALDEKREATAWARRHRLIKIFLRKLRI